MRHLCITLRNNEKWLCNFINIKNFNFASETVLEDDGHDTHIFSHLASKRTMPYRPRHVPGIWHSEVYYKASMIDREFIYICLLCDAARQPFTFATLSEDTRDAWIESPARYHGFFCTTRKSNCSMLYIYCMTDLPYYKCMHFNFDIKLNRGRQ